MSKYKEALEKIANPIKYLQEEVAREGAQLNGIMAIELSNDAAWLKDIAKKALDESEQASEAICSHCGDVIEHPLCRNCEIALTLPDEEY